MSRARERTCLVCGGSLADAQAWEVFCGPPCRARRAEVRGAIPGVAPVAHRDVKPGNVLPSRRAGTGLDAVAPARLEPCACGCGAAVPPSAGPRERIYASPACSRRAHNANAQRREKPAKRSVGGRSDSPPPPSGGLFNNTTTKHTTHAKSTKAKESR